MPYRVSSVYSTDIQVRILPLFLGDAEQGEFLPNCLKITKISAPAAGCCKTKGIFSEQDTYLDIGSTDIAQDNSMHTKALVFLSHGYSPSIFAFGDYL